MSIILNTLEQGLIYAIMAMGVLITYSILDFPDLSVDGTFPLGAAVSAVMIVNGHSPVLALCLAAAAGAIAGLLTGLVHVRLKVRDLFSGIIMMTALYAVNMHIAAGSLTMGRANLTFFNTPRQMKYVTIFDNNGLVNAFPEFLRPYSTLIIVLAIVLLVKLLLDLFLKTRAGYLLRAVGDNETVVTSLAQDKGNIKIMGLVIANAFVALSGAVLCQQQHTFEISMGTGSIAMALASVIIGLNLFGRLSFVKGTTAAIIGSIIYKACVALAIQAGVPSSDMKLVTAFLFLIILSISGVQRKKAKLHA
ncbi:MAG: ABC transporter permease [Clostridia bacterium]|nr:ABC transporter permease [Clostridia bacterium]